MNTRVHAYCKTRIVVAPWPDRVEKGQVGVADDRLQTPRRRISVVMMKVRVRKVLECSGVPFDVV